MTQADRGEGGRWRHIFISFLGTILNNFFKSWFYWLQSEDVNISKLSRSSYLYSDCYVFIKMSNILYPKQSS